MSEKEALPGRVLMAGRAMSSVEVPKSMMAFLWSEDGESLVSSCCKEERSRNRSMANWPYFIPTVNSE